MKSLEALLQLPYERYANQLLFQKPQASSRVTEGFMPQCISEVKNLQKSPIFSPFNLALHFIMSQNLLYLFHPN